MSFNRVSRPRAYSLAAAPLSPPIPWCHSSSTRRAGLPPGAMATAAWSRSPALLVRSAFCWSVGVFRASVGAVMAARFAARAVRRSAASVILLVFMVGFLSLWWLVCFLVLVLVRHVCGRVCSFSRVKGGVERCGVCREKSVWWRGRRVLVFLAWCCLCGYWCVVGDGVPSPFFFRVRAGWPVARVGCLVFLFGSVIGCGWFSYWREG